MPPSETALQIRPGGVDPGRAIHNEDASGTLASFDILNLVFEERLSQAEIVKLLHQLSEGDQHLWMAILLQRVSSLMEVSNQSTATLSLDELLPRMMRIVAQALNAEHSSLFLLDPQSGELFSRFSTSQGDDTKVEEVRFSSDDGIAGTVFTSGEAVIINDPYNDGRFDPETDKRHGYKTRNILCAPLLNKDGESIGISQVLNKRTDKGFTIDDLGLLQALTRQAAAALENAQLHELVEQARKDEEDLLEISSELSSELVLDTLLQKIVGATTRFLDAERSTLWIYDPVGNVLWIRVGEGGVSLRIPSDRGIAGACFTSGERIHIPDAYKDDRFDPSADKKTGFVTRNILCMPVNSKNGRKLGVLQVLNKKDGAFTLRDERRLRAMGAQAGIALENAQLFDEVMNVKNYNESILKSLSNGVVTLDAEDKIIKVNAAAAKLLHLDMQLAVNQPVYDALGKRNPEIMKGLQKVKDTAESTITTGVEIKLENGESSVVNLTIEPLIDIKETPIGWMIIAEDITGEKQMQQMMGRFMPKEIVDKLLEGGEAALGGQNAEVSILFTDIRRFTSISEKLGPRETVDMLNEYFNVMVDVIFQHHGILDKYIGDAIMAVFGAPFSTPLDANNALTAANNMVIVLNQLNEKRMARGQEPIAMGLGISTGEVVAGNIGSPKRMDYTVIGDPVNLAARLESATKQYGVQILVSEFTREGVTDDKRLRELDLMRVKGKDQPVSVYEALDCYDEATFPNMEEMVKIFEEGLMSYREREWNMAMAAFRQCLQMRPDDYPSRMYIERCEHYLESPPGQSWDGVWTLTEK